MKYGEIVYGIFIKKLNRFVGEVIINNEKELVHIKNTGRLKELLIEGVKVVLERSNNPNRKTRYSLISVYKDSRLVNIDSQAPNQVVINALCEGRIKELNVPIKVKPESKFGNSRFDVYYETNEIKGFIEVKGVTLEKEGIAIFPDAPTSRGVKHVYELINALNNGYKCMIFFLIQMQGCKYFTINKKMDPNFYEAILEAKAKGVSIIAYDAIIEEDSMTIGDKLPVKL